ncbi:methionine adenosyltransferase [Acetobacteraceae bacterium]|nr:methionine adenosyltransferase [Acetobacteraceae bacterium]
MRNNGNFYFTSESVSEGHPDKVADRISDTVLDAYLAQDPEARVACETLVTTNRVVLAGEIRGPEAVAKALPDLIREAIKDIGYDQEGFSWKNAEITSHLHAQSAHIAQGVDASAEKEEGAGDQGIMFGYASSETPSLMPAPLYYAHNLLHELRRLRRENPSSILEPDAKSQVTLRYENGKPVDIDSIVVSTQHGQNVKQEDIRNLVSQTITKVLPSDWKLHDDKLFVNPTGIFEIGGPDGDAGVTGRKIIVDTYGGAAPHGGGAFSGKDPTKVDRSAAYAARYLAKNVVAAGLSERCTIQLSYAIGVARPLSIYVDMDGTGKDVDEDKLARILNQVMDLSPRGIREHLRLNRPIYVPTSAYGHFGREPDAALDTFTWERTDLVPALKTALNR